MYLKQFLKKNIYFFRYIPPEYKVLARKGEVYCFVQATAKHSGRLDVVIKMMWEATLDKYINNKNTSVLVGLEEAADKGKNRLRELIKKDDDFKQGGVDVNFFILVVKDSKLYMQRFGDVKFNLYRNNKYIDISQFLDKYNKNNGSTVVRKDDLFILGTEKVVEDIVEKEYDVDVVEDIVNENESGQGVVLFAEKEILLQSQEDLTVQQEVTTEGNRLDEITGRILQKTEPQNDEVEEDEAENLQSSSTVKDSESISIKDVPETEEVEASRLDQEESESGLHPVQSDSTENSTEERMDDVVKEERVKPVKDKTIKDKAQGQRSQEESIVEDDLEKKVNMRDEATPSEKVTHEKDKKLKEKDESRDKSENIFDRVNSDIPSLKENLSPHKVKMKLTSLKDDFTKKVDEIGIIGLLQSVWNWILSAIQWLINGITKGFAFVFGFVGNILAKKYGREPWFKKLSARVSQLKINSASKRNVKGSRVDSYKADRNSSKILSYAVLLVAVVGLGYMGYRWTQKRAEVRESRNVMQSKLDEAENYLEEAEKLVINDRNAAQLKAYKARVKVKEAEEYVVSEKDEGEVLGVTTRLNEIDDKVNKRIRLKEGEENIKLYLDGRLKFDENSSLEDVAIREDENGKEHLYITDSGLQKVYDIDLYTEEVETLPDEGNLLQNPLYVDYGDKRIYIYDPEVGLVYSDIEEMQYKSFKKATGMGTDVLGGKDIADLAIWTANENAYLVSRADEAMLKCIKIRDVGYRLPMVYVEDFVDGTDLFADNSYVYTLAKGEDGLKRYVSQGGKLVENTVNIVGVYPEPTNLIAGFTSSVSKRIYVYDESEKRIVILDKSDQNQLVMHQQLVYDGDRENAWKNIKDMAVDKRGEYLYILDGVRVWRVEL